MVASAEGPFDVSGSCLTDEQVAFFHENGFLVVRGLLARGELDALQRDTQALIEARDRARADRNPDYSFRTGVVSGAPVLNRIEYVVDKTESGKHLLAHPFVLRSVERLQGPSFIPTWDSVVMKMPDEGIIVPWHRDDECALPDGRPAPIFNVDFYLDEAGGDTCLWVFPGSHLWSRERALAQTGGAVNPVIGTLEDRSFSTEGAVPVPMQPGDVLFHHIMLMHGSPDGRGNRLRRTIYLEFRPGEVELAQGPHTPEYLERKQQVLLDCIRRRAASPLGRAEVPYAYRPVGELAVREIVPPLAFRVPHAEHWRARRSTQPGM